MSARTRRANPRWRAVVAFALGGGLVGAVGGQVAAGDITTNSAVQTGDGAVSVRCTTQTPNFYQSVYEPSDQSYRLFVNTTLGTGSAGCVSKPYKLAMLAATGNVLLDQWSGTMPATATSNLPNTANTGTLDILDVPADKSVRMFWLSESP